MDPRITTAARLQQQKNYAAAEQIYHQILSNQPRNPDALLLLGLLMHETGRNEPAAQMLMRAVEISPNRPEIRQTFVGVLQALGRFSEAIIQAREIARMKPNDAEARYAVAQLMLQAKDPAGALPYARRAAELNPRAPAIFLTLSRVHLAMDNYPDAIAAIDRALVIDPKFADGIIDKAGLLQARGRLNEAIALYEAGLKLSPKSVAAWNNLGSCYLMLMRAGEAIRCFEEAAKLWPNSPKPRNNVGATLKEVGQIDEAIPHFEMALRIDPTFADGYCNIGSAYATIAEHQKAIDASREALRMKPDYAGVGSNLLMVLLSPTDISPQEVFDEHREWDRQQTVGLASELPPASLEIKPNRRIRIAYLSADFREHSVRYFIEPVLANHDRSQFEVICYATGRRRDEVSDRLAKLVDAWHSVSELTDRQLAGLIRSHGVDILVDLAGHTADNRLLAFARKPAPVQVTYLGYPTTTGMATMDYRLTDSICDPPGNDAFYTEKLVRLPNAFFVYGDDASRPFDPVLPADRNGVFTFGSFNAFTKMNDETFVAWANILREVPNSRLLLKAKPVENPSTRRKLFGFFADRGIAAERLDVRSWVTLPEHLALLSSGIDLMLDTFPYNGHTTSCQSLWMGVPMVTRSGDSFRSRVGKCMMRNLDLMEFVADSWDEYQRIAVATASDISRLRALRPTLRDRMIRSPLCDVVGFTRSLENAYQKMLQETLSIA
jgi:protein O-GlcNAc transferase